MICGDRIDGVRERWIVEHIRALELGGADELGNMGPAHEACGREKTRDDHARAAHAKRQKLRHIGATASERPLPGSKASSLKRKINGTVVPRETVLFGKTVRSMDERDTSTTSRWTASTGIKNTLDERTNISSGCISSREPTSEEVALIPQNTVSPMPSAFPGKVPTHVSQELLPALPAHLAFLFEERPLLPGESSDQYDAILTSIAQEIKPRDAIEGIWTKNVVDLIWEAKRLRGWRQRILMQARLQAAETLIKPVLEARDTSVFRLDGDIERKARTMALGWLNGCASETATFEDLLHGRGLTTADVIAKGFELKLQELERVDRMVMNAEDRRDSLLREIERKRASFGKGLRAATEDIIDVEPNTSSSASLAQQSA
ncbi:HNH endonuclease [Methylobacterium segetis]|uniref:HNH endonuclease n=1 Tax=Methylobacterium segetis TaxID=2488750 RepID=UPI001404DD68|nr:HNH endonuclease [Methylobacterium segetis]